MQVDGMGLMQQLQEKKFGCAKMYRQDVQGKDHMRENLRRLRHIQRSNKAQECDAQRPVKALWHSEKYKDVQSRVKTELEKAPPQARPESANFLRSHSRCGPPSHTVSRPPSPVRTPTPDRLTVPSASSVHDIHLKRHNIDFVKLNGRTASQSRLTKSPSLTRLDDLKQKGDEQMAVYQHGVVPKYLKERKEKWRQEEDHKIANMPDPAMPEGHRAMADDERGDTLQLLLHNQKLLMTELQSLPLTTDTLRVRKRKQDVEDKLAEIDEAVKIFSRPKVFIKIDT